MTTMELKSELLRMIERETDVNILNAIRTILQKTSLDPMLKERLTSRAQASEADIRADRVFSREDVMKRTDR